MLLRKRKRRCIFVSEVETGATFLARACTRETLSQFFLPDSSRRAAR